MLSTAPEALNSSSRFATVAVARPDNLRDQRPSRRAFGSSGPKRSLRDTSGLRLIRKKRPSIPLATMRASVVLAAPGSERKKTFSPVRSATSTRSISSSMEISCALISFPRARIPTRKSSRFMASDPLGCDPNSPMRSRARSAAGSRSFARAMGARNFPSSVPKAFIICLLLTGWLLGGVQRSQRRVYFVWRSGCSLRLNAVQLGSQVAAPHDSGLVFPIEAFENGKDQSSPLLSAAQDLSPAPGAACARSCVRRLGGSHQTFLSDVSQTSGE